MQQMIEHGDVIKDRAFQGDHLGTLRQGVCGQAAMVILTGGHHGSSEGGGGGSASGRG
ncbi:hypothetical protein [Desulfoluna spongiiphila]|uniref:hypothetical protein n=1 Tax=Desulfoluna spongiiphila TaxID=419481 RepID=UPI001256AA19|nr:hypothetical protein [Desulfoluna spongiiphila]VVS91082.1 hypothetical protein DBB_6500 [Desulfoluna spongiiphila]